MRRSRLSQSTGARPVHVLCTTGARPLCDGPGWNRGSPGMRGCPGMWMAISLFAKALVRDWCKTGARLVHLDTSTELRSSVACAQPDLFNKPPTTESGYKTLSDTTFQSSTNVDCMDNCPRLGIGQATTLPASPKTDVNITSQFNFSFGFLPNTVSKLAAAIRAGGAGWETVRWITSTSLVFHLQ